LHGAIEAKMETEKARRVDQMRELIAFLYSGRERCKRRGVEWNYYTSADMDE